jgi:hypothetical protein
MASIEHLSLLIRSLSKSEKRYFKWSYPWEEGDKVYSDLYCLIEIGEFSAQGLREKIKEKYPNSVFEPACKHLYKMLMRSLRNYESEKTIDNKLSNLLCDVKILFRKGFFELCFSEIEKAKKLALDHEKFTFYLLFARAELQFLTNLEFPDLDESALIEKHENINEILQQEQAINKHSSLFELLSFRYQKKGNIRSAKDTAMLNDLLLEEYQINANKRFSSFESDKSHLRFQSDYFFMSGSPEQSLQVFEELNLLFQKNKSLWSATPVDYIYLLHGILTNLYNMKRPDGMSYVLKELQQVPGSGGSIDLLKEHFYYFHQLGFLMIEVRIGDALILANEYEAKFSSKIIPPNTSAAMHFRLAVLYFIDGNFSRSLKLVNSVLNTSGKFISSQLYALGRLLHLLIHLELNNCDYLQYEIKSVERKLKNGKKLFELERTTLHFLKKWLNTTDYKRLLQDFDKSLAELEKNDFEGHLFAQFPFRKWLKAFSIKKTIKEIT